MSGQHTMWLVAVAIVAVLGCDSDGTDVSSSPDLLPSIQETPDGLPLAVLDALDWHAGPDQDFRFVSGRWRASLAGNMSAVVDDGFSVLQEGDRWQIGVLQVGRGNMASAPTVGAIGVEQSRASRHGVALSEWWLAGSRGVQHIFRVATRPAGDGALSIDVGPGGGRALASPDGRGAILVGQDGEAKLRYGLATTFDATGRQLPTQIVVIDGHIRIDIDDEGAVYPVIVDPLIGIEEAKLTPSDVAASDEAGASVAVLGDVAVVGAPAAEAAYVFRRSGTTWTEAQILTGAGGAAGDAFGSSVGISGDRVAVGAPGNDGRRGGVYVFLDVAGTFTEETKLTAMGASADDILGASLGFDGDRVVAGAPGDDTDTGAAYVFLRTGTTWSEEAKLVAMGAAPGDLAGTAVAIEGDLTAVGAPGDDAGLGAGVAYRLSGATWSEEDVLLPATRPPGGALGTSVDVGSGWVILGAPGSGGDQGSAYAFAFVSMAWTEDARIAAATGAAGDRFGASVAVYGDIAVVGAPEQDSARGAVYVFRSLVGSWAQDDERVAMDSAAGDRLGASVALDTPTMVVGAPVNLAGGAAYVFELRRADGTTCLVANDCASGFCIDGVCCDSMCGGGDTSDCQACSFIAGGRDDGRCLPLSTTVAPTVVCRTGSDPICNPNVTCDSRELLCPAAASAPDGTDCDDGLACTGMQACMTGMCVSTGAPDCDDGDPCTTDSCAEPGGTCTNDPIPGCMPDAGTDGGTDAGTDGGTDGGTDAGTDGGADSGSDGGGIAGGGCACDSSGGPGSTGFGWLWSLAPLLLLFRRRKAGLWALLLLVIPAALLSSSPAAAQSIALERFSLAESPEDGFHVSRPEVYGHLRFGAHVGFSYGHEPLVYETTLGDASTAIPVVENQLTMHTQLSLSLWDRLLVYGGMPLVLTMTGDDLPAAPPHGGAAFGDVFIGTRARIVGEADDPFVLGAQLTVSFPSAAGFNEAEVYAGDTTVTFSPELLGELRVDRFRANLTLGATLRTDDARVANLDVGQEVTWGIGATYRLVEDEVAKDRLLVVAEAYGSTATNAFFERESTPFEGLLGLRGQVIPGLWVGGGVGPGFGRGYGSPAVRAVATVGWIAPGEEDVVPVPPSDRDGDRIFDDEDQCPDEPEDYDGFEDDDGCPDPDNDGDTIPDADDPCPNEPEDFDGWGDEGCPDPDNDADGILDGDDRCPDAPGPVSNQGCPERIEYDREEHTIQIRQRVEFELNHYDLANTADGTLYEVRDLLRANPSLLRVRVEGHTDHTGTDRYNLVLSSLRAGTVIDWLVDQGISADRLEGFGCGKLYPLGEGDSDDARQLNRRVEYIVVEPPDPDAPAIHEGCIEAGSETPEEAAHIGVSGSEDD